MSRGSSIRVGAVRADRFRSAKDVLILEIIAAGTKHSAQNSHSGAASQKAFESLLDADQWMMYRNTKAGVVHWDFVSTLSSLLSYMLHALNPAMYRAS